MASSKELDSDTCVGLRILADSTNVRGSEGVARRLYKAADTGLRSDYDNAETIFDSLPSNKRSSIKNSAEIKAETVKLTKSKRKKAVQTVPNLAPAERLPWDVTDEEAKNDSLSKEDSDSAVALESSNSPTPVENLAELRQEMANTLNK